MAQYADNNYFFKIDTFDLSAYVMNVEINNSIETNDASRGNTDWVQRTPGRFDITMTVTVSYDDALLATYIQRLQPGRHDIEYGSEGAVTGKPRHVQSMILTEAPFTVGREKSVVAFELSLVGQDAPSVNMYAGGVY
jgi:hypothetical protein